jgi:hypothetical protein
MPKICEWVKSEYASYVLIRKRKSSGTCHYIEIALCDDKMWNFNGHFPENAEWYSSTVKCVVYILQKYIFSYSSSTYSIYEKVLQQVARTGPHIDMPKFLHWRADLHLAQRLAAQETLEDGWAIADHLVDSLPPEARPRQAADGVPRK